MLHPYQATTADVSPYQEFMRGTSQHVFGKVEQQPVRASHTDPTSASSSSPQSVRPQAVKQQQQQEAEVLSSCEACGKPANFMCSACKDVHYCSTECQVGASCAMHFKFD